MPRPEKGAQGRSLSSRTVNTKALSESQALGVAARRAGRGGWREESGACRALTGAVWWALLMVGFIFRPLDPWGSAWRAVCEPSKGGDASGGHREPGRTDREGGRRRLGG